jgi:uncharacterized protein (TIGR04255 family)
MRSLDGMKCTLTGAGKVHVREREDVFMPHALPEPDTRLLARPPLELVICEIRAISGTDLPASLSPESGLALKDAVIAGGFVVQRLEQAQQQAFTWQVQTAPGEQPSSHVETRSAGWQLIGVDGTTATVLPGVVTVQTTNYVKWEDTFRPVLRAVVTAVAEVLRPKVRQRVGLRYVDRLVDPAALSPAAWKGRVSDSLLGPIADPVLGERIISGQQQVELRISDHNGIILRHGPFEDRSLRGAISYMLDIDSFDITTSAFDAEDTLAAADELNLLALSIFQSSLTSEYLESLRDAT